MPKKSERTRQRIIDAANRLFYHQGYHNTSFTDVVDATNIPRGNIYYYFKTKDEILVAAIRHRTERISAMLDDWSGKYRTPIERLHRFVNILEDSADSLTRFGCPMGSLNIELGKNDPSRCRLPKTRARSYAQHDQPTRRRRRQLSLEIKNALSQNRNYDAATDCLPFCEQCQSTLGSIE
jgi:AcrR family transcriptional regulator